MYCGRLELSALRLITIHPPRLAKGLLWSLYPRRQAKIRRRPQGIDKGQWSTLAVVCIGTFMALLDAFIVNVGLPTIRSTLNANAGELELVIASLFADLWHLPDHGRTARRYLWTERLFVVGMAVFTIASATCGLATSPEILIVSRALQGFGAAIMYPQIPFNNPSYFQRSKARHRPGSVRRC